MYNTMYNTMYYTYIYDIMYTQLMDLLKRSIIHESVTVEWEEISLAYTHEFGT